MKSRMRLLLLLIPLLFVPLLYNSCGMSAQDKTQIESEDVGTTRGNPMIQFLAKPYSMASQNFALQFCLEEIVLYKPDHTPVHYQVGGHMVSMNSAGTELPAADFPPGDYIKVTLIASNVCGGSSAVVQNAQGTFSTQAYFGISFLGSRNELRNGAQWLLDFQTHVDSLEVINDGNQIALELSAENGSF